MNRVLLRRIIPVSFLLCLCSTALAQDGTLLVANRAGGSISLIDLETRLEVARLPIGPIIPHEVSVSPDGRFALTSEYGPNANHGRHVILIDIQNASIVGRIDLGPNSRPHTALFHPDGQRAVATMQDSDLIALIDLQAMEVIRTYPTGGREGHMVRLSPDGSRAYVTSRLGEGTLSVIFLDEDRSPVVIQTGAGAEGLSVSPDGSEVWVANRQEESISVIDTGSLQIVDEIDSNPFAGRVEIGSNGLAVAVNGGGGGQPVLQYLRLFDAESHEMITEVPIRFDGQPGDGNFGVLIHGGTVFVGDPDRRTILMFDLDSFGESEPEVLASAHESPDGLAWSPVRVEVMN
jgi:YVTN family beta-propeller protein